MGSSGSPDPEPCGQGQETLCCRFMAIWIMTNCTSAPLRLPKNQKVRSLRTVLLSTLDDENAPRKIGTYLFNITWSRRDANANRAINVFDAVHLINYSLKSGPLPDAPPSTTFFIIHPIPGVNAINNILCSPDLPHLEISNLSGRQYLRGLPPD